MFEPTCTQYYQAIYTNPDDADSDDDGLDDGDEYNNNAMPNMTDTDKDGISDNVEVNTGGTKAYHFDTDLDNLPDGYVEDWWRISTSEWNVSSLYPHVEMGARNFSGKRIYAVQASEAVVC